MSEAERWDAIIIGGGPAGLSGAIWLGRYHRRVLVLDAGEPRNQPTWAVHGFPGLPEVPPDTLRRRLAEQARAAGAEIRAGRAVACGGQKDAFRVEPGDAPALHARRLVLAFGRQDVIPDIEGVEEAYGTSVFHCPDCDGPTIRGKRVAVLGADADAAALALFLVPWARHLTLLPGENAPARRIRERLEAAGVEIRPGRVTRLRSEQGLLRQVELGDVAPLACDALFFHHGTYPACDLAHTLGLECDAGGHIEVDRGQETSLAGVYAAGDITGHPYLAVSAAAEGVRAALALHRSLLPDSLEL